MGTRFGAIPSNQDGVVLADLADVTGPTALGRVSGTGAPQALTPAQMRQASQTAGPVFDVTHYGATGDGSTDDTTAIQAAMTAANAAGGGVAYLPPGKSYAVGVLDALANVTLSGYGATLIRNTVAGSGEFGLATLHDTAGVDGFTVEGVTFDIAGDVATPRRHLAFDGSTNLSVKDVRVVGLNGLWATWFRDCVGLTITGYFQDTGAVIFEDGIHITGGRDVVIDNCIITSGDDCISLTAEPSSAATLNLTDVTISNCVLASGLARAINIHVDGAATTAIRNVAISNIVGTSGTAGHAIQIRDSTASGVGSGLISQIKLSNVAVDSTATTTASYNGAHIQNAADCTLTSVRVSNARVHGFWLQNAPRAHLVACISSTTQTGAGFVIIGGGDESLIGCTTISAATGGYTLGSLALGASANAILVGCRAISPTFAAISFPSSTGHRIIGGNLENVLREKLTVATELEIDGALNHDGSTVGFFGATPVARPTGVAVTAAGIHAALVSLGLITA